MEKFNWIYYAQFHMLLDGSVIENIAVGLDKENISEDKVLESLQIANLKSFVLGIKKWIK